MSSSTVAQTNILIHLFLERIMDNKKTSLSKVRELLGPTETPKERKRRKELEIDINYLLTNLTHREREIIKLRYGFYGEEHRLEEIGILLSLTKQRVQQIEDMALKKLHRQITIRER